MTQTLLLSPPSLEYSQNYFPFSSLSQLSKHPINFGVLLTFSFGDHGVRKSFYCTFSKTPNWLKLELDFKGTWHIQHTIAGFPVKASEYIIRIIFSVHSKHAVSPELSPSLKYHATADLKADTEIKDCVYIRARQQHIDNPVFPAKKVWCSSAVDRGSK